MWDISDTKHWDKHLIYVVFELWNWNFAVAQGKIRTFGHVIYRVAWQKHNRQLCLEVCKKQTTKSEGSPNSC